MCFSETASFGAAGLIGSLGVLTLTQNNTKLLAYTPLLLAAQQFTEGLIWGAANPVAPTILTYAYSFFAYLLWPIFLPYAIRQLEKNPRRRRAMNVFLCCGITAATYFIYVLSHYKATGTIQTHHVDYNLVKPTPDLITGLYCAATIFTCFASSHKWINVFGAGLLFHMAYTVFFFSEMFASVWCFFAAALSCALYFHFAFHAKRLVQRL